MAECYMITRPRNRERESIQLVKMLQFMIDNDVHKFIIGEEVGITGYEHWQVRIKMRNLTEEEKKDYKLLKDNFGQGAHIEPCSDTWEYERKDGVYYDEGDFNLDRIERLKTRLGEPNDIWQAQFLKLIATQDVRQIDVAYDPQGNKGKSWLINYLFETGQGHYIPPYATSIEKMVQTCASLYLKEWRPYLIIDIPRAYKWSEQIYTAIESIKDGIVIDMRYQARPINIRGVKVVIMCNTEPKVSKLSADRWRISTLS
jgi:hypothetical protein